MQISAPNIRFIFGLKLKQLRAENSLSLSQLSEKTGISKSYLNEIEKGKKYPKPEKIDALAEALGTSYDNLVSLQLDKKLTPISSLVKTDLLSELPLDFFGVSSHDLLVLLSTAPVQFSAFVDAVIRIGREHDFKVESLYFSVLRSYQEMHDNYFPELETKAQELRKQLGITQHSSNIADKLKGWLETKYNYSFDFDGFKDQPQLNKLRYLLIPGKRPKLLLNKKLSYTQQLFILSREVGFNALGVAKRPLTSSWIETLSFEHVLNNFRSYYLASALLLDERLFTKGLVDFTNKDRFTPPDVIRLMEQSHSNAEMFMLRITNLVPKYFRFPQLFFTRYNHALKDNVITLTKALNGSGLPQNVNSIGEDKACQRLVAYDTLTKFREAKQTKPICTVFKVQYEESHYQYLVISVAYPMLPSENLNCCISVGFLVNNRFISKTRFVNDPSIKEITVTKKWVMEHYETFEDGMPNPKLIEREEHLISLRKEIGGVIKK